MLNYVFMQNALIAILIITPLLAMIGTIIVNNKMAFFSDAIGHSTLTAIAFGVLFGIGYSNYVVAIFSSILAVIITILKIKQNSNTENIISIVSSVAVALGIVILSINGGFAKYTNYIIGDILSVTHTDITLMAITLIIVSIIMYYIYNKLILISFNQTLAKSRGASPAIYEIIYAIIVATVVSFAIKWVGVLVINSLIVIPCATAKNYAKNFTSYMTYSIIISLISGILGLVLSYYFDASTGATIVLINGLFYLLSRVTNKV